jgi:hypothetical protein
MTVRELMQRLAGAIDDGEVQVVLFDQAGTIAVHPVEYVGLRDQKSHGYGPMPEVAIRAGSIPPEMFKRSPIPGHPSIEG